MKSFLDILKSNRQQTSINGMPKSAVPIITHKDERDLNVLWIEIMKSEEAFRRLISNGEKYEEALKRTQENDEKLLNSLAESKIGSYSTSLRDINDEYLSVVMKTKPLVELTSSQIHEIMVVVPSQYHSAYEHLDSFCKKRDSIITDVEKLQDKLDRLKLKCKLTTSRKVEKDKLIRQMKSLNSELMTETRKFHNIRISLLQSCLQAEVLTQINHYGSVAKEYDDYIKISRNSKQLKNDQFSEAMKSHLQKIQQLKIVD